MFLSSDLSQCGVHNIQTKKKLTHTTPIIYRLQQRLHIHMILVAHRRFIRECSVYIIKDVTK